jgi:hypothetical protein
VATKTTNALGCEAKRLATQVNAYTIVTNFANLGTCTYTNDTIGGSPMESPAFQDFNANFDIMSVHLAPLVCPPDMSCPPPPPVPVPPAVWLFGSGCSGCSGWHGADETTRKARCHNPSDQPKQGWDAMVPFPPSGPRLQRFIAWINLASGMFFESSNTIR